MTMGEKPRKLLVLYASKTENALDAVERIGREAEHRGCPTSIVSTDEFDAGKETLLIQRTSCSYGWFSSKSILGDGGFGNVYRGKLGDGTVVAVKRLKDVNGTSRNSQFRTELEMISLAVHRNLLRLIGYCVSSNERLLVYPYMSNCSVASRLKETPERE